MSRFTPLEIQRQRFRRVALGYSPEDVAEFLALVAEQLEEDVTLRGELKAQLAKLCREIDEHRQREQLLRGELEEIRRHAEEMITAAQEQGRRTLAEAQAMAQRLLDETARRTESIEIVVSELQTQRRGARADLRRLAALLDGLARDDEAAEARLAETTKVALLRPRPREAKA